jgi:hypothetical protein
VTGDAFLQGFHFAPHFLALLAAVCGPPFRCHFHAKGVHVTEELQGFLWHPVFQSVLADEQGGFHQGARGVTQQNPVDWEMNVCLPAGAVKIIRP